MTFACDAPRANTRGNCVRLAESNWLDCSRATCTKWTACSLALIALTVGQGVGGRLVQWVNNKKVPPILGSSVLGAAFGDAALKRAVFCVVPLLYCGLTVHHRSQHVMPITTLQLSTIRDGAALDGTALHREAATSRRSTSWPFRPLGPPLTTTPHTGPSVAVWKFGAQMQRCSTQQDK